MLEISKKKEMLYNTQVKELGVTLFLPQNVSFLFLFYLIWEWDILKDNHQAVMSTVVKVSKQFLLHLELYVYVGAQG